MTVARASERGWVRLLALAVASVLGLWWVSQRAGVEPSSQLAAGPSAAADPATPAPALDSIAEPEPVSLPDSTRSDASAVPDPGGDEPAAISSSTVFGFAKSLNGVELAGIAVGGAGGLEIAKTDAAGRFVLAAGTRPGTVLRVVEPGYVAMSTAVVPDASSWARGVASGTEPELLLFAARPKALTVRVQDEQGRPIAGADVTLSMSDEQHQAFTALTEGLRFWSTSGRTDGGGAAHFEALDEFLAVISARRAGYSTQRVEVETFEITEVKLVLRELVPEPNEDVVLGQVLLAHGGPGAGAVVRFTNLETAADEAGQFELPLGRVAPPPGSPRLNPDAEAPLVVYREGYAPAVVPLPVDTGEFVTVVLNSAASIAGRLVRSGSGAPCPGWRVKLLDGQVFDRDSQQPFNAEDFAAGHLRPRGTGADGGFRFDGLVADRTYRLRAWNLETFEIVVSEPIPAGTERYRFEVPHDFMRVRVAGRVTDPDGVPIEACRVRLTMAEHEVESGMWMQSRDSVQTDGAGYFEFLDVPRSVGLFLRFNVRGFPSLRYDLEPGDPGIGLQIVMGEQ